MSWFLVNYVRSYWLSQILIIEEAQEAIKLFHARIVVKMQFMLDAWTGHSNDFGSDLSPGAALTVCLKSIENTIYIA